MHSPRACAFSAFCQSEAAQRQQERSAIRELANALKFNTTLQHIDLRENDIGALAWALLS
jgi:hypothetical protein